MTKRTISRNVSLIAAYILVAGLADAAYADPACEAKCEDDLKECRQPCTASGDGADQCESDCIDVKVECISACYQADLSKKKLWELEDELNSDKNKVDGAPVVNASPVQKVEQPVQKVEQPVQKDNPGKGRN